MLLLNGECLELMQDIPDKSIDMILCDLPYGTTACKWDSVIPFEPLWKQYNRIIKSNGAIVLFSAQPFTTKLIQSNFKKFRYCWYWKKHNATGGIFARVQPMRCIEDICVFYSKMPTYNPQGIKRLDNPIISNPKRNSITREKKNPSLQTHTGYPKHLLEFKGVTNDRVHPTQKPTPLLEYLIKTYTNKGEVVLDNCMGVGSTGVACVNTDRDFIGIELDRNYFDIAKERIDNAKKNSANDEKNFAITK